MSRSTRSRRRPERLIDDKISVFRPVAVDERLRKTVPPVQAYITETLSTRGVEPITSLAVDGLRLLLLPPSKLELFSGKRSKDLAQVQQRIKSGVRDQPTTVNDQVAAHGSVLRGYKHTMVTLTFETDELIEGQERVYAAAGFDRSSLWVPYVALCTTPEIDPADAGYMSAALSSVAGNIVMSFGPIMYDFRKK